MESACLRHTDIPHTSRLFADLQYCFDCVKNYYRYNPHDPESYARAAAAVDYPDDRRAGLVAALRKRNGDNPLLDRLAKPGTVAVVTGQQVGLFSGPAYTIYKALTAMQLADSLNERGIPAVPVFWLATEDHDFAEIDHAFVFDARHKHIRLSAAENVPSQAPVGTVALTSPPLAELREALAGMPFTEEVLGMVESAYKPGETFGCAFQHLVQQILGQDRILFVDPLDQAIRELAAPVMRKALADAPALSEKLLERNKELQSGGYHAQVHVEKQTSLVFLLEGKRRLTLKRGNGDYVTKERRFPVAELADLADHLSPNALLRPVVQDFILPTVAYVGGPAELAYIAQSQVIYDDLLGRMPVVLARASFTLLDARSNKLMQRYGLTLPSFFPGEDALRETIAGKLVPANLSQDFERARGAIDAQLDRLQADVMAFDPTLKAALDKSRGKVKYQLSKMERKTARETLRRDQRAGEEAAYMANLVFPEKHLQERYYSILPFLAKHGPRLVDTLAEFVALDCPDHKVLVV
ncbi:MAG TPA: bacillithiol biosynthesis cysteine-adding enzyme BshC [Bryobacteraceae bacterium]|nr:bacillithiol biosynthesis cysteine-adding enzyme BshC [Bryobacteraceae bacterium]